MSAWLFQKHEHRKKLGDKAPWSVGWYDPDGKKRSKLIGSHSMAEKFQRKTEGQIAAGVYETVSRKSWADFTSEYESKVLASMEPGTRQAMQYALNHFERIAKPAKMRAITTKTIADYVAARRLEPCRKPRKAKKGQPQEAPRPVSPATVNKELRSLRAIFRKAARWGYMPKAPEFEFLREPGKLATYVTPEHFALLYRSADVARWPNAQPFQVADWWRGLLMMAYTTGWRIGSLLALRWEHVDLDGATAISLAADNKGKRDVKIPLQPTVIEHLRKLKSFSPLVFPWNRGRRDLFEAFGAIQQAADVKPEGGKARYGFHDLRRAFATMNAANLTSEQLQALMQHKDYQTTQRYINLARQLKPASVNVFVPSVATA